MTVEIMTNLTTISNLNAYTVLYGRRRTDHVRAKMARQAAKDVLESYAFGDSDEERYTDDDT